MSHDLTHMWSIRKKVYRRGARWGLGQGDIENIGQKDAQLHLDMRNENRKSIVRQTKTIVNISDHISQSLKVDMFSS